MLKASGRIESYSSGNRDDLMGQGWPSRRFSFLPQESN